jgi:hypothetical protein
MPAMREDAPRAYLTAPYLAAMSQERRLAHAPNERSASAPRTLSSSKAHGPGCGCCAAKSFRPRETNRAGETYGDQGFPNAPPLDALEPNSSLRVGKVVPFGKAAV